MKRITITPLGPMKDYPSKNPFMRRFFAAYWRADSTRYAVSAYGRTVAEVKQRLFLTVRAEQSNRDAFCGGFFLCPSRRNWKSPI